MLELPVLHIETPSGEAPALRDDHALRGLLRYLDFGGDGVRAIFDVEGRVFQHRGHAGIKRHRSPPPHQRRSARNCRHKTLDAPVVERRLRQPRRGAILSLDVTTSSASCAMGTVTRATSM